MKISERSRTLQYAIKMPMICLVATASLVSGTSILLLKIVDTIVTWGDFQAHWGSLLVVIAAVLYTADTQLQFLNLAI